MTYSIIARCPHTGRFGVGTTTFSLACGRRNESLRPNVGVSKSQAFYLRRVDPFVLNMLAQGHTPAHIATPSRPTIPITSTGNSASSIARATYSRTPAPGFGQWAGHRVRPCYAADGNGSPDPKPSTASSAGFMSTPTRRWKSACARHRGGRDAAASASRASPSERSACCASSTARTGRRSICASTCTTGRGGARRIFEAFKRCDAYYRERSRDPRNARPEEDVMSDLAE